jgi:sugar O-acyltransferase (sialic acid O-acetyltransferase NeuD family)
MTAGTTERPVVIFGTGDIAQIAGYYFERDGLAEVAAYTVDGDYRDASVFEGRQLVAFEEIVDRFPPGEHEMFIALSYSEMNRLRQRKYDEAKQLGYALASYVSPDATYRSQFAPGDNCFIFEDNTIQPWARIGNNVTLWSGNHIGHHSVIDDHVFVASHVVVSGHCHIESNCFLGVNATVGHNVRLATGTLLGAGAAVTRDTEPNAVYVPAKTVKRAVTSDRVAL